MTGVLIKGEIWTQRYAQRDDSVKMDEECHVTLRTAWTGQGERPEQSLPSQLSEETTPAYTWIWTFSL